jgi:hypothetical protein
LRPKRGYSQLAAVLGGPHELRRRTDKHVARWAVKVDDDPEAAFASAHELPDFPPH